MAAGVRHASYRNYDDLAAHFRSKYGAKFDDSELYPQFREWVGYSGRLKISGEFFANRQRTGYLGVTGGWRPAFMLLYRSNDTGSGDLLRREDRVIAKQGKDGKYYPFMFAGGYSRTRRATPKSHAAAVRRARRR